MPATQRDGDRNGNCKAGVVVDTGIVVKQEFDFCKFMLHTNIYDNVKLLINILIVYFLFLPSPSSSCYPSRYWATNTLSCISRRQ